MYLITGYHGGEISTSLSTSPPPEAVESNKVAPQPLFLYTRQAQGSCQPFVGHSFQLFHQLCCHSVDVFKDLHIFWAVCSTLHAALKVRGHQCQTQQDSSGQLVMMCLTDPRMGFALSAARAHCWLTLSCCQPAPPDPCLQDCPPQAGLLHRLLDLGHTGIACSWACKRCFLQTDQPWKVKILC